MVDDPNSPDMASEPQQSLSERVLDRLVYLPAGLAVTVVHELPQLTERGRKQLGVQVGSARAVGQFVVLAGSQELKRRAGGLLRGRESTSEGSADGTPVGGQSELQTPTATADGGPRLRKIPGDRQATAPHGAPPKPAASVTVPSGPAGRSVAAVDATGSQAAKGTPDEGAGGHGEPLVGRQLSANVPDVGSLGIPGFDTLSASQVVQRLAGLDRTELVAVRAYEAASRGRRTILSRVDQLLEQRA